MAKYKQRKKESVAKLERTTNNLDRVNDIIAELEKQVGPLKRQKEKAEKYLDYKKQLEDIEVSVLVKVIENLNNELKTLSADIDRYDQEKVANDGAILIKENQSEELSKKMITLDHEVNELQGELLVAMNNVNDLKSQKVELDANRKSLLESSQGEELEKKAASLKAILQDALVEYNDRVKRYNEAKAQKDELSEKEVPILRSRTPYVMKLNPSILNYIKTEIPKHS